MATYTFAVTFQGDHKALLRFLPKLGKLIHEPDDGLTSRFYDLNELPNAETAVQTLLKLTESELVAMRADKASRS